jgi:hypothetical protein
VNLVEAFKIIFLAAGEDLVESDSLWYEVYVDTANDLNMIPSDITDYSHKISRGEMAYLIVQYLESETDSAEDETETEDESSTTGSESSEALDGLTLIASMSSSSVYLVNDEGTVEHEWDTQSRPNLSAYLLEDGNLLKTANGNTIEEYDWDGNLIW